MPRTVYNVSYCDELIKEMGLGKLDVEIYSTWGICKDTFIEWRKEHPEFKEAYQIGFAKCEAWWVSYGRQQLLDQNEKGFKYFISIMNNKFQWGKEEGGKGNTTNIQIGNMNLLNTKSESELLEILNNKLSKLNLITQTEVVEATVLSSGTSNGEHNE